jgi:hypothetical protein
MERDKLPYSPQLSEKEKQAETPVEPSHILKLKMISQIARKLAYWIDEDTQIPSWTLEKIDASLAAMKEINSFFMEQTVDVKAPNESKLIPTKPEMWQKAKIEGKKRFNESTNQSMIFSSKYYKEHGGKWRKKRKENG